MERRLAAILVADVAGYSRLMGQDEAGALKRLKDREATVVEPAAITPCRPIAAISWTVDILKLRRIVRD
jgi:hypothetical protein